MIEGIKDELRIREAYQGLQAFRVVPLDPTSQLAVGDKTVGTLVGENPQATCDFRAKQQSRQAHEGVSFGG